MQLCIHRQMHQYPGISKLNVIVLESKLAATQNALEIKGSDLIPTMIFMNFAIQIYEDVAISTDSKDTPAINTEESLEKYKNELREKSRIIEQQESECEAVLQI